MVIIQTRSYLQHSSWFVPYHQEVLRAHQSHFCLRAIAEDRGFQSDVSDIRTGCKSDDPDVSQMTRQGQEVLEVIQTQMAEDLHHHHVASHHREQLLEDEKQ